MILGIFYMCKGRPATSLDTVQIINDDFNRFSWGKVDGQLALLAVQIVENNVKILLKIQLLYLAVLDFCTEATFCYAYGVYCVSVWY